MDFAFAAKIAVSDLVAEAEAAGLLAGDVLLQVGDIEIDDIYAFVYALQVYKPGDVVRTRYLRDGRVEEVRVTLATRDRE